MAVDAGFRGIGIKNCAFKHGSVDYACLPGFFSYGWRATAFPYIPCPLSLLINKSGETRVSPGKSFFPRKTMESGIQPLAHNDQVVTDAIVRFQFIKPPHVQWWLTRRGLLWRGSPGILCGGSVYVIRVHALGFTPRYIFWQVDTPNVTRVKKGRVCACVRALRLNPRPIAKDLISMRGYTDETILKNIYYLSITIYLHEVQCLIFNLNIPL